eukprot:4186826-Prymnesium_polylepis.1
MRADPAGAMSRVLVVYRHFLPWRIAREKTTRGAVAVIRAARGMRTRRRADGPAPPRPARRIRTPRAEHRA